MANYSKEHDTPVTSYLFAGGSSTRKNLIGAVTERGPLVTVGMIFALAIVSFALYIWSREKGFWDESLIFALFVLFWSGWHYLGLVLEIRVTGKHLSFRRLFSFRSIPWERISRVRVYSLRTMGLTYICIGGDSHLPLAFFPLLTGYPPENWKNLIGLVEQIKTRVPVKHTM